MNSPGAFNARLFSIKGAASRRGWMTTVVSLKRASTICEYTEKKIAPSLTARSSAVDPTSGRRDQERPPGRRRQSYLVHPPSPAGAEAPGQVFDKRVLPHRWPFHHRRHAVRPCRLEHCTSPRTAVIGLLLDNPARQHVAARAVSARVLTAARKPCNEARLAATRCSPSAHTLMTAIYARWLRNVSRWSRARDTMSRMQFGVFDTSMASGRLWRFY